MNASRQQTRSMTRSILLGALMVGTASAGAWLLLTRGHAPATRIEPAVPSADPQDLARSAQVANLSSRVLTNALENDGTAAAAGPAMVVPLPEATPYCRQLVDALCRLDQPNVPRTPERVVEWKQNLGQ